MNSFNSLIDLYKIDFILYNPNSDLPAGKKMQFEVPE